eukprot:1356972-Amphidinium_carterae.2
MVQVELSGEYLCATLHLEALALCSGACIASGYQRLAEQTHVFGLLCRERSDGENARCLAQAGRLKQELRSALESLKDVLMTFGTMVGSFDMSSSRSIVSAMQPFVPSTYA